MSSGEPFRDYRHVGGLLQEPQMFLPDAERRCFAEFRYVRIPPHDGVRLMTTSEGDPRNSIFREPHDIMSMTLQ
jgi:hypothetical protein